MDSGEEKRCEGMHVARTASNLPHRLPLLNSRHNEIDQLTLVNENKHNVSQIKTIGRKQSDPAKEQRVAAATYCLTHT